MADISLLTFYFNKERPARWTRHVIEDFMRAHPEGGGDSPGRSRTVVQVGVLTSAVSRINIRSDEGFFQQLCFACAQRYPHIWFKMLTWTKEEPTGYWENTSAEYEKGEVRFRQMINDPNDQYLGRYAFISETLWRLQEGCFVYAGEPAE